MGDDLTLAIRTIVSIPNSAGERPINSESRSMAISPISSCSATGIAKGYGEPTGHGGQEDSRPHFLVPLTRIA